MEQTVEPTKEIEQTIPKRYSAKVFQHSRVQGYAVEKEVGTIYLSELQNAIVVAEEMDKEVSRIVNTTLAVGDGTINPSKNPKEWFFNAEKYDFKTGYFLKIYNEAVDRDET